MHRSRAYIYSDRPASTQARIIIRMAVACYNAGIPYEMRWDTAQQTKVSITVEQSTRIPTIKPLPKAPKAKPVTDWKPKPLEAVYRLDVLDTQKGKRPAMVLEHSCGLCLTNPVNDEWIDKLGNSVNPSHGWRLTHTSSGKTVGLDATTLTKARAQLLYAASLIDWNVSADALTPAHFAAGNRLVAQFGKGHAKTWAEERLAHLEKVAA